MDLIAILAPNPKAYFMCVHLPYMPLSLTSIIEVVALVVADCYQECHHFDIIKMFNVILMSK